MNLQLRAGPPQALSVAVTRHARDFELFFAKIKYLLPL